MVIKLLSLMSACGVSERVSRLMRPASTVDRRDHLMVEPIEPTIPTLKSRLLMNENPENNEQYRITETRDGTAQSSGPIATTTHRADTLTPQTRTIRRSTTRRSGGNTQRDSRQADSDRKQTQNNRRTTQTRPSVPKNVRMLEVLL
jgi:hypothetical protein